MEIDGGNNMTNITRKRMELDELVQRILNKQRLKCLFLERIFNETEQEENETQPHCPVIFDGWLCWNRTRAGEIATQKCPTFVSGFDSKLNAFKVCNEDGEWFRHPLSGKIWSNYTTCVNREDFKFRELVNDMYLYGYSVSLVALVISLIVFLSFRSLKCTRIKIHIQFFLSLALTCLLWIIWLLVVVDNVDIQNENPGWCISLHLWIHYLMLANYFWMFCEGLHLHLVLVVVFVKDVVAMRWFFMIGWVLPLIFLGPYGAVRAYSDDNNHCWINESNSMWILTIPVCISMISSIVFLVNFVRVLLTKLHPSSVNPAPIALKKAARATLILIPLFGLQNILLPFRPERNSEYERPYQFASAIILSLQGLLVSIIFCFTNHDVIFAIKCYMCYKFPALFGQTYRETVTTPATLSRDVNV